ncbi:uncharacterized protein LOC144368219 isoform X5 [Ictidomys tridecemlineatus]
MATRPAARGRPCALLPPSAAEPGPASLATAAASMVGARSLQRRAGAPGRVCSSGDVGAAGSAHSGEETARRTRGTRCHRTSAAFFRGVSRDLRQNVYTERFRSSQGLRGMLLLTVTGIQII